MKEIFDLYSKQSQMDCRTLAKIFKESLLFDKYFNSNNTDIIFNKIKTKNHLKITYE